MATKRVAPEDLQVTASISWDHRVDEFIKETFQQAAIAVVQTLANAQEQARKNVARGRGPSEHTAKERASEGWSHAERDHGFDWSDTGALADAIKIHENMAKLEGKTTRVGLIGGSLRVAPIETENPYTLVKRVVNYGAYLELGFTPKIIRMVGGNPTWVSGRYVRYPFLAPAMYMATKDLPSLIGVSLSNQLRDLGATRPGKRKGKRIIDEQAITYETLNRIKEEIGPSGNNFRRTLPPVQDVEDLMKKALEEHEVKVAAKKTIDEYRAARRKQLAAERRRRRAEEGGAT
jgi:hypothetical protein